MEPGTALGIVSLGLQVCEGLLNYYDAWKGYDGDIRQIYDSIADLNKTFVFLDTRLQSMRIATPMSALPARVAECLTACSDGLHRLNKKLQKFHRAHPGGFAHSSQAGLLRLLYPFRSRTLEKLKDTVQYLIRHLKLAMQVLLLDISVETGAAVARIEGNISSIETLVNMIHTTTLDTQIQTEVAAAGVQALLKAEESYRLRQVLEWLEAPDRSINHEEARRKYEPGTGTWFLECQDYQDWVSGRSSRLWLHGKAGCCKTVLCSTIIEDMRTRLSNQPGSVLVYFYFSFADIRTQNYTSLLLSMVAELSQGRLVHPMLLAAYNKAGLHKPRASRLEEIVIALLQQIQTSYLIIDGLDECPERGDEREQVMKGLERVVQRTPNMRVLITSRKETDIEEFMQTWSGVSVVINERCVNADIDIFVKNALATDKKLLKLPDETKKEIKKVFHEKSDAMFRWAALQLQSIRSLKILRPSYISTALHTMPRTLDATYERILATIDERYHDEVRLALGWLTFSEISLSVAELAEACSIRLDDPDEPFVEECSEDTVAGLIGILSPLVLVEQVPRSWRSPVAKHHLPNKFSGMHYTQRIRLAHFSVKEYLISGRLRNSPVSQFALGSELHHDLAQRCCAYLLIFMNQVKINTCMNKKEPSHPRSHGEQEKEGAPDYVERFMPSYPLLHYAIHRWSKHQALAEDQINAPKSNVNLHLKILEDEMVRVSWLRLANTNEDPIVWHDNTKPLYWASLLGFYCTTSMLCERASLSNVNHVGGKYGTALQAAAYKGHGKIAEILIQAGADVNIPGRDNKTALFEAVHGGYDKITMMLINAGANINPENWSPLRIAARKRDEKTAKVLVEAGARVTVEAFMDAIGPRDEQKNIAELLLNSGLNPSGHCGPLIEAARIGSEKLVRGLLQANADIHGMQKYDRRFYLPAKAGNALMAAADFGHEAIVQLLIEAGVDSNAVHEEMYLSPETETALTKAVLFGIHQEPERSSRDPYLCHESTNIIQKLLDAGADIHALGDNALYQTVKSRYHRRREAMAEFLLAHGADVNGQFTSELGRARSSILYTAVESKDPKLVRALLEHGADVNYQGEQCYGTALQFASFLGNIEIVKILLEYGADVNVEGGFYGNALNAAKWTKGGESIARLLLDKGADVRNTPLEGKTNN